MDTPSAFLDEYNQRMLSRPGLGQLSPTMAKRKGQQRVSKDQLAMAVRKDFNAAMVSEAEIITSFLYSVHNHGESDLMSHCVIAMPLLMSSCHRQDFPNAIRASTSPMTCLARSGHAISSRSILVTHEEALFYVQENIREQLAVRFCIGMGLGSRNVVKGHLQAPATSIVILAVQRTLRWLHVHI